MARTLIFYGRLPGERATVVESVSLPTQVVTETTLNQIHLVPRPKVSRVTLVVGDRYSLDGEDDVSSDWRTLCRGAFEVARVPGKDTGAMLRPPNLESVTTRLLALLAQADRRES